MMVPFSPFPLSGLMPKGQEPRSCSPSSRGAAGQRGARGQMEGTPHLLQALFFLVPLIAIALPISPFGEGSQRCAATLAWRRAAGVQAEWAPSRGTGCTERFSAEEAGRKALRSAPRAEPQAFSSQGLERALHASQFLGGASRHDRRPGTALLRASCPAGGIRQPGPVVFCLGRTALRFAA